MANHHEGYDEEGFAFIADYVPRQCGIATFTYDLSNSVAAADEQRRGCSVIAINDIPEGYKYDDSVRFEIRESAPADYRQAAEFINISEAAVVCLQHEYGIFGGRDGSHVLSLLRRLRRPVVTTLHTILKEPTEEQRLILRDICRLSTRVVVMAERAREFLQNIYDVPEEKIALIHHGIPDVPFIDPAFYKDKFGVEGRPLVLTFGLLSPNKGIEHAIRALPAVVKEHPDVVYMVVGATHPHVRRTVGEAYRTSLQRLARELGVEKNLMFQNRFVELSELCEFLGAADVYVTPYNSPAQIVSGTLAYALGTGNAVISTPYWYAEEMLADGRGRLVDFGDSDAIAAEMLDLLSGRRWPSGIWRSSRRPRRSRCTRSWRPSSPPRPRGSRNCPKSTCATCGP